MSISLLSMASAGCSVTSHESEIASPSDPGGNAISSPYDDMVAVASEPGPIDLEVVHAADWSVDRAGLINLKHPKAKAAGLKSGDEPIIIRFYGLKHPAHGLFMIDSGIAHSFRSPKTAPVGSLARKAMNFDALKVRTDTSQWLSSQHEELRGVFVSHLHADHVEVEGREHLLLDRERGEQAAQQHPSGKAQ